MQTMPTRVLLAAAVGCLVAVSAPAAESAREVIDLSDVGTRLAWGVKLTNVGDQVVFRENFIWADTAGVLVGDEARGVVFQGNTFVRANDAWQLAVSPGGGQGVGLRGTIFKENRIVSPPNDATPPAEPTSLTVRQRINGYELQWQANREPDVLGYYVYRNGKRVEPRLKCAYFYVDTTSPPGQSCQYAISAVDTSGNEGPLCPAVEAPQAK